jgi:serine/threonine protein kinase
VGLEGHVTGRKSSAGRRAVTRSCLWTISCEETSHTHTQHILTRPKLPFFLAFQICGFEHSKTYYGEAGRMNTFAGTKIHMAPELFEKPRRYTNKVDMWSLGLIGMQFFTTWDLVSDDE